jgi:carboxypeptidase Taq
MADLDPLLTRLKALTVPLVRRVVDNRGAVDAGPLRRKLPVPAQREFVREVVAAMGIDQARARLDLSTHPFCGGVGPGDVRMTSRFDERDLAGGLFGAIHEAGHGLYEQGLSPRRARTPLGGAISMAIHESQSRLWENLVARGRPFWKHWLPRLRKLHPALQGTTLDAFWRAANRMAPSFIRVEADELTYNLHIVLRYEIERDLFAGELEVADLPERWNDDMRSLLGVTPRHDAEGVLQDIHWAAGLFGYFATYTLGNVIAAQLWQAFGAAHPNRDADVARGDFAPLLAWLRAEVHRHGCKFSPQELVQRATGAPVDPEPYLRYLEGKYGTA